MAYDLIIRNGSVVSDGRTARLAIGITDGRIESVAGELSGGASRVIDASGLHVLPGVIDAHVHFNDPGRADWEGFETGSAALVAGGGTCFFDMPLNASPPTTTADAFDRKVAAADGRCATDFGLWGGIVPGNSDELEALAERGVVGFKAFMSDSGIEDFPRADDPTLLAGMARAAQVGLPVAVHAEDHLLTTRLAAEARTEGRTAVRDYLRSRPVAAELDAIRRALSMAAATGCALHVVHVSSGAGITLIAEARQRGVDVTCETCPHYLVFTGEDVERLGAVAKCAPPPRSADVQAELWAAVADGSVDLIASDHSPSPPAMKEAESFFDVWGGIAGCQSTLPVMLVHAHRQRGIPLARLATLLAEAPAGRFGITEKGRIAEGYDADLVLVDVRAGEELREEHLLYRHRVSPYVGMPLHGIVRHTIVRGQAVFASGGPTGVRPGRLVRPSRPGPAPEHGEDAG